MSLKKFFEKVSTYIKYDGWGEQGYIKIQCMNGDNANIKNLIEIADRGVMTTDGYSPLLQAALNGNMKVVKAMLDHGVDINQTINNQPDRQTALIFAVLNSREELVKYLLDKGADVNVGRDAFGKNTLYCAKFHNNPNIVAMIEAAVAKSAPKQDKGPTGP